MGSNWLSVDNNFPSFTGKESPEEQIRSLHNYLFCLKEQLQYSLNNLTSDNWNAEALKHLTDDAKEQILSSMASINNHLSQLQNQINDLKKTVSNCDVHEERITAVEEAATLIEVRVEAIEDQLIPMQEQIGDNEQRISEQESTTKDIDDRLSAAEATMLAIDADIDVLRVLVDEIIQKADDGSVTIGKDDNVLNLVGQVYVNGVLLEIGGTNETA